MGHGCHDCGCPNGCECPGDETNRARSERIAEKAASNRRVLILESVNPDNLETIFALIELELSSAAKWPAMNSAHEGFAILAEEVDELWEHVKTNQKKRDPKAMRAECVQIAAMAIRFIEDVIDGGRVRK